MNTTLQLKRYPASHASELINDSGVAGANVADALDTLQDAIDAIPGGNVTVTTPTTVDAVASWDDTAGELRPSTAVKIHKTASDKFETAASFRALADAADGVTITFNFNTADAWEVVLGGNRTLAFTNASLGQMVLIRLIQDGTGSRTVSWWANIKWHHSLAPVLDSTASGSDLIVLLCVGEDGYGVPIWEEVCRKSSAPRKGIFSNTDGATITFDLRKSPKHKVTLGGARTLALVESHVGQVFEVTLVQDATGSRTVTWWSGISWAGGSAPTLSTAAGKADVFGFIETASGSYYGFVVGQGI